MINIIEIPKNLEIRYISKEIGYGVFTTKPILKNERIEVCYCLEMYGINEEHPTFNYLYSHPATKNQLLAFGYGSIYNHSNNSNISWAPAREDMKFIVFFAIRDIEAGEELTHNYGTSYWEKKDRKLL
jgi:SET domain-containing protein